ncbi:YopT-type cysteine protease domain-containing protein [Dickeya zeae]|uniref:YopT-type cysteine protease domain-containing protein n=1 Tax=Dickeya zeae TaxID=204042 RepID=UPI00039D361B|nr:YopT-type cysteine protease domain-containing protein [Dickeya zeae]
MLRTALNYLVLRSKGAPIDSLLKKPAIVYNQSDKINNLYYLNRMMVMDGMCLNISLNWAYYLNRNKWDIVKAFKELEAQHQRVINTQAAGQILYDLSLEKYKSQKKAIETTMQWQFMEKFEIGDEMEFDATNIKSKDLETFINQYPFVLTCFYLKEGGGHATLTSVYKDANGKRLSYFDPNYGEFNAPYGTETANNLLARINTDYIIGSYHLIGINVAL